MDQQVNKASKLNPFRKEGVVNANNLKGSKSLKVSFIRPEIK